MTNASTRGEAATRVASPSFQAELAAALRDIAVLTERLANRDENLKLQAGEYERRLKDLNHAHEQARIKEADFLRSTVYEKSEAERLAWQRDVDAVVTTLSARRDSNIAIFSAIISVLSIGLWALSVFWGRV